MSDFLKKSDLDDEKTLTKSYESRLGASTDNSGMRQSSVYSGAKNYIKVEEESKK